MTFTRMRYHFVTTTDGREPWLTERLQDYIRCVMADCAEESGGHIIAAGGVEDHEHIVAAVRPHIAPAAFIGRLKSETSRRIHRDFPSLHDFAWQEGYGGFTLWPGNMGAIVDYVMNQKSHHRRDVTWEAAERVE